MGRKTTQRKTRKNHDIFTFTRPLTPAYTHTEEQPKNMDTTMNTISIELHNFIESATLEQALYILMTEQHGLMSEKMRIPYCAARNKIEEELYHPEFGIGIDREQFLNLFYNVMYHQARKEAQCTNAPEEIQRIFQLVPKIWEVEALAAQFLDLKTASFSQFYMPKNLQKCLVDLVKSYTLQEKVSYLLKGILLQQYALVHSIKWNIFIPYQAIGHQHTLFPDCKKPAYALLYNKAKQLIEQGCTEEQKILFDFIDTPEEHARSIEAYEQFLAQNK